MDELDEIARFEIGEGWDVIDADDEPIGRVAEVHDASFTMESSVGERREIAFGDIESADDGHVTLAVSGGELPTEPD